MIIVIIIVATIRSKCKLAMIYSPSPRSARNVNHSASEEKRKKHMLSCLTDSLFSWSILKLQKSLHQIKKFQKKKRKSIRKNLNTISKNWTKKKRNSRRTILTSKDSPVSCNVAGMYHIMYHSSSCILNSGVFVLSVSSLCLLTSTF